MSIAPAIDTISTTNKHKICQSIRTALSSPSQTLVPDINKSVRLFDEIPDELDEFVRQFEAAGGKCEIFTLDRDRMAQKDIAYANERLNAIYSYVKTVVTQGRCQKVLCASPQLKPVLDGFGIATVDEIPADEPVDAAIAFAEFLLPRTGSLVFSQRNKLLLYPSIRNLASRLIVLTDCRIAHDLNDLLGRLSVETGEDASSPAAPALQFDMLELLRPTPVPDENFTPAAPHITLVMLVEK